METYFSYNTFVEKFKKLIEEDGRPDTKIAEDLGIARDTFSRYKSGERRMKLETVVDVARFYNISTDYLFGLSNTRKINWDIKKIGLSDEALSLFTDIANDENLPQIAYEFPGSLKVAPSEEFYQQFSAVRLINRLFSDKKRWKSIVEHLKKYLTYYTYGRMFWSVPEWASYKMIPNREAYYVMKNNAFNHFQVIETFKELIEVIAKEYLNSNKVTTKEDVIKAFPSFDLFGYRVVGYANFDDQERRVTHCLCYNGNGKFSVSTLSDDGDIYNEKIIDEDAFNKLLALANFELNVGMDEEIRKKFYSIVGDNCG